MKRNRRKKLPVSDGFTLLEVLVAFGILFSFLTLLAAGFTRHLELLQRMERTLAAESLADREIARAALERRWEAEFTADPPAGYSIQRQTETVSLDLSPEPSVELDQVTAVASWSFRDKEYAESSWAGFRPQQEPAV